MNRYTTLSTSTFKPLSTTEIMMLPAYKQKQYDDLNKGLDTGITILDSLNRPDEDAELVDPIREQYRQQYNNLLQKVADTGGSRQDQLALRTLNNQIQKDIAPTGVLGAADYMRDNLTKQRAAFIAKYDKQNTPLDAINKLWTAQMKKYKKEGGLKNEDGTYKTDYLALTGRNNVDLDKQFENEVGHLGFGEFSKLNQTDKDAMQMGEIDNVIARNSNSFSDQEKDNLSQLGAKIKEWRSRMADENFDVGFTAKHVRGIDTSEKIDEFLKHKLAAYSKTSKQESNVEKDQLINTPYKTEDQYKKIAEIEASAKGTDPTQIEDASTNVVGDSESLRFINEGESVEEALTRYNKNLAETKDPGDRDQIKNIIDQINIQKKQFMLDNKDTPAYKKYLEDKKGISTYKKQLQVLNTKISTNPPNVKELTHQRMDITRQIGNIQQKIKAYEHENIDNHIKQHGIRQTSQTAIISKTEDFKLREVVVKNLMNSGSGSRIFGVEINNGVDKPYRDFGSNAIAGSKKQLQQLAANGEIDDLRYIHGNSTSGSLIKVTYRLKDDYKGGKDQNFLGKQWHGGNKDLKAGDLITVFIKPTALEQKNTDGSRTPTGAGYAIYTQMGLNAKQIENAITAFNTNYNAGKQKIRKSVQSITPGKPTVFDPTETTYNKILFKAFQYRSKTDKKIYPISKKQLMNLKIDGYDQETLLGVLGDQEMIKKVYNVDNVNEIPDDAPIPISDQGFRILTEHLGTK